MANKGMNAEPPIARFQMEHQPRRPGYAKRWAETREDDMRKFLMRILWWLTAALAFLLLILHALPENKIVIDTTSLVLLIIIMLSPFLSAIRKIKFGDFEAEIDPKKIERIRTELDTHLEEAPHQRLKPFLRSIQRWSRSECSVRATLYSLW